MNWAINLLRPYRYWLLSAVLMAVFFGCLTKQEPDTFSLPEQFVDSLSRYDSVRIILKDSTGKTLDLLFHGKVVSADQLRKMPAPHSQDAKMRVTIVGYQRGQVVYLVDRIYDGILNQIESHQPLILPTSKVRFEDLELRIPKKTTLLFPAVTVEPAHLADKSLLWTSSNPKVFQIEEKGLRGISPGTAYLQVSLRSDTAKHAEIPIIVIPNPKLPESLKIAPDTLKVAAKGRAGRFTVQAFPITASAVTWSLDDPNVASISGEGQVQGLKRGTAKVRAVSKEDETIADSAMVSVSEPVSVERVRFLNTKLELFVEGAAEMLRTETLPLEANPEVSLSVRDSSIARILEGRILGLREGETFVFARSVESPTKTDSLRVKVYPSQKVDSVELSPDTLRLYTGGESKSLQVKLYPSSLAPLIQWASASAAIASVDSAGKVSPLAEGRAFVTATSQADSGKKAVSLILVKRDVPILDVGRDTVLALGSTLTLRPVVTQEYGKTTRFRWDLDGDGVFEGESDSLKSVSMTFNEAKEIRAGFFVRDTEGNDTTVYKKVRIVDGPAVLIISPLDSTYTRIFSIDVSWSVNGIEQDSLKKQGMKIGANTITRSAKDEAGKAYSASVTVIVDTTPPQKPMVRGPLITNSQTPTWTWATGEGGGSGIFKFWLDVDDSSKGRETRDTSFTPATDLVEGSHTIFVAERDLAGNWSNTGRLAIRVDLTPPGTPMFKPGALTQFNTKRPTWVWLSGGNGSGRFRVKINDADLSKGAIPVSESQYTSGTDLAEGGHTLYIQESDTAGNWSQMGTISVTVDLTAPLAPVFTLIPRTPINTLRPTWKWRSGSGIKRFRYRMDDANLSVGALVLLDTQWTNESDLAEGRHTLYIQESDSAGNWSTSCSSSVVVAPRGLVGGAISTAGGYLTSLKIASSGNLIAAYQDQSNSQKITVKEFSKSEWHTLGAEGFSSGSVGSTIGLDINPLGIPFVAFAIEGNIVAMKSIGNSWAHVGEQNVSTENVGAVSMSLDPQSNTVMVYTNPDSSWKAYAIRFDGAGWHKLGDAAVSEGVAYYPQIKIDPVGAPIVALRDNGENNQVMVERFDGVSWRHFPALPSSKGTTTNLAFALDKLGKPIVAYDDSASNGRLLVKKYNGSSWENIGLSPISTGEIGEVSISINSKNQPVVAFSDLSIAGKIRIALFNGNEWQWVGDAPYSDGYGVFLSLAIDALDVPYVAFTDPAKGNKAVVVRSSFDP